MSRSEEVAENLRRVRERISAACAAARRVDDVTLVVVTKTFPASDIDVLASLGVTDVGENRDQEARRKRDECRAPAQAMRWHMIGQLQRNKAASVARWADVVEAVDRPELVDALARGAREAHRRVEVLLQVNLDNEPRPGRGGVAPQDVPALADLVAGQPGLILRGVMGVAPHPGDPDAAFSRLASVSSALQADHPGARVVSAGMSGDLEQAIAHGATQVRIGGAVLGHRRPVQ